MKKLNILMIFENLGKKPGGVQTHVFTLSKALRKMGHNVSLFSTRPLHFEVRALMQHLLCLLVVMRIIRIVRRVNIDLVHVHGGRLPLILGYFVCRMTKRPLVATIHEAGSLATKLNRQYKRADKIIAISQEVNATLRHYGVNKTKIVYVPNMLDEQFFESTGVHRDRDYRVLPSTLVFIGRLGATKIGILKILLEATPKIVQKVPIAEVWIVGSAGSNFPEISTIARHINENMGKKVVHLLGYVKNPTKIFDAADVVIGVGRVAMEAMAYGKATIVGSSCGDSTFTGGLVTRENVDELVKYNLTGRNYAKRINAHQLAELIVNLIKDNDYRKKVGEFCKEFAMKNFGVERVVPQIESVYISCLKYTHAKCF